MSREALRLLLSEPQRGTVLKARLCTPPVHPRSVFMLLEALAAWYRSPLHAVCVADAAGIQQDPERWVQLLSEPPGMDVRVEWVARPVAGRRTWRSRNGESCSTTRPPLRTDLQQL